jgi:hypothetical protein
VSIRLDIERKLLLAQRQRRPMTARLPVDERLERAGELVVRARKFYDLWSCLENAKERPATLDAMDDFSEFFKFTIHAHFVAFVVHMAALFETRNDTINLWRLAKDMKAANMLLSKAAAEVDALLREATPVASKVTILRSNLFAHRSDSVSYASAFELAQVTPDQLHNLTEIALKIANQLLLAKGLRDQFVHPGPHEHAGALLQALLKNQCPR